MTFVIFLVPAFPLSAVEAIKCNLPYDLLLLMGSKLAQAYKTARQYHYQILYCADSPLIGFGLLLCCFVPYLQTFFCCFKAVVTIRLH